MLTFWRINHLQELEWHEHPTDLSTFIVIIAVRENEFGTSTYVLSNGNQKNSMRSKFNVTGHYSLKPLSQFDVKTESGATCLKEDDKIAGRNALRVYLDSQSHKPFACAELERLSVAADEEPSLEAPNVWLTP